MTFQATLERHLRAIRDRDLPSLEETLSPDRLTLITADGRLVTGTQAFLAMHRDWFQSPTWSLNAEPITMEEPPIDRRIDGFIAQMRQAKVDLAIQMHGSGTISNRACLFDGTTAGRRLLCRRPRMPGLRNVLSLQRS